MEILTKRDVSIRFNWQIPLLRLPIVTSIKIKHSIAVGKVFGLTRNVTQPWHAELVSVDLSGSSYIGAFEQFINKKTLKSEDMYNHQTYGEKGTVQNTWKDMVNLFLQYQNDLSNVNSLFTSTPLTLYIENEPGSPYTGFIENVDGDENISKPFIIEYSIKFIGVASVYYSRTAGTQQAAIDQAEIYNPYAGTSIP
jgi:hypothetical protein